MSYHWLVLRNPIPFGVRTLKSSIIEKQLRGGKQIPSKKNEKKHLLKYFFLSLKAVFVPGSCFFLLLSIFFSKANETSQRAISSRGEGRCTPRVASLQKERAAGAKSFRVFFGPTNMPVGQKYKGYLKTLLVKGTINQNLRSPKVFLLTHSHITD